MESDSTNIKRIKVFISSPSDLRDERDAVKRVLEDLNHSPSFQERLKLLPFAYEDHAPALVGQEPQRIVDQHMLRVEDADIVICMFWLRMGTPTRDLINPATNQPYQSGTEYEFLTAYETLQKRGSPQILLYRCTRPPQDLTQLDLQQYAAVEAFFQKFSASETFQGLIGYFKETSEFERKVRLALEKILPKHENHSELYWLSSQREPKPNAWMRPWNLPPRAAKLVGRESLLEQVCARIRATSSHHTAIALTGMAGVGKSSLAAESMHLLAADSESFQRGVTWVRCNDRHGADGLAWIYDQLLAAWGVALASQQVPQNSASEGMLEMRESALRARLLDGEPVSPAERSSALDTGLRSALILLDNVEQGLPINRAIDTLSPLGCVILLTSRQEPSSPRIDLVHLDVLEAQAAHDVFVAYFLRRGGNWSVWHDDEAVTEVVEALGGLPLAIELAAARAVRAQTEIAALAQELQDANRLGKLSDPLDPTQGVRYAFSKSLECLNDLQRARFAAFGLLTGTDWPRVIVEQMLRTVTEQTVLSSEGQESGNRLDTHDPSYDLDALIALSLIALVPYEQESAAGSRLRNPRQARIRIHPLLHDLARDELSRRQHTAVREVALKGILDGIVNYVHTHSNDTIALGHDEALIVGTLSTPDAESMAPGQIVDVIDIMWSYLDTCCRWHQGVELLKLQLRLRRKLNDTAGAGNSLTRLGLLSRNIGRTRNAARYFEDALRIHRLSHNRVGEGETLNHLGVLARNAGRSDQAASYYEMALVIHREVNNAPGVAWTLTNLGVLRAQIGDAIEASRHFRDALVMHGEVGNPRGQTVALNGLGNIARKAHRWEEAEQYYSSALAISRSVGDKTSEGVTLTHLGNLARNLDHSEEAFRCYQEALTIHRETGDLSGEGWALMNLGVLWRDLGQQDEALEKFHDALTLFRKVEAYHAVRIVRQNINGMRTPDTRRPNSSS